MAAKRENRSRSDPKARNELDGLVARLASTTQADQLAEVATRLIEIIGNDDGVAAVRTISRLKSLKEFLSELERV